MTDIKSICVYCGSSDRGAPNHRAAARDFGTALGEAGIALIFGGGRIGLMGVIADAVLAASGQVIGIIPEHLERVEVGHRGVSELIVTASMHSRKQAMFERADAFVVLPGGLGTLDETFEIVTWRQLKLHDKPIILVDQDGYWAPFLALIDAVIEGGYARPEIRRLFEVVGGVEAVLPALRAAPSPTRADAPDKI